MAFVGIPPGTHGTISLLGGRFRLDERIPLSALEASVRIMDRLLTTPGE